MPPKSKKGQKMDLASFLGPDSGGDWADALPTAPAASFERQDHQQTANLVSSTLSAPFDISTVPNDPPFVAYVGNLAFTVTERDLETLFGDSQIKSVRLIMDPETQRPKGYGYVDFIDRQGLIGALSMNGENLQKRQIRINVAEGQKTRVGGRHDDVKFASDWRKAPATRDSTFRDQFSRRNNNDEKGGSTFARRDNDERRGASGTGWGSSGNAFQRREDDTNRSEVARPFQRRDESTSAPTPSESTAQVFAAKPKSNPFGSAAPRDEQAIQAQIEERRLAREAESSKSKAVKQQQEKSSRDRDVTSKKPASQIDNLPKGEGSWRRPVGAGPAKPTGVEKPKASNIKKEDSAGFSAFKSTKHVSQKPHTSEKVTEKPRNAFEVLEQE